MAKRRTRFLLPSTRAFFKERKTAGHFSFGDFLHGYVYGRWPYLYIGIATGEHRLARWVEPLFSFLSRSREILTGNGRRTDPGVTFADTYHGKAVPLAAARSLVTVKEDITLRDLEQVIPYARARDLVLHNPGSIVVLDCPCRASRAHPCLPLDVCLIVGEPFASFVAEHHPSRARRITQAEALGILEAEDERGHAHHAFFKGAMLNRFYAICNCCSCCCGAMQAHRNGTPMLASSGYVGTVDLKHCTGCGECNGACQFGALHISEGFNCVDAEACMGCGVCVSKCDHGALSLVRDASRGAPLEIHSLMQEAVDASGTGA